MLELRDVSVTYGSSERPALERASLAVEAGECVALVGPSGSGKTTLLRSINGTVVRTGGSIYVDGVDVGALRGGALRRMRARIAVVAQQHDMVSRLAVYQNVMAGALGRWDTLHALRFLAAPRPQELAEAAAALARVGIEEKLRTRTSSLSGGQQQRVAIARALVQRPVVLLADEPIASVDPQLGEEIVRLLCALARERRFALVCSLHQPEIARRYFDRIARVADGSLTEVV